jgi:single-strand DNA-binding protein
MFGDLNSVSLIGNITNDINVRYTPNGKAVANFGMATNRRYKLSDSTEWKDQATFHNIVMFGNSVEMFSQRAHKGTRVYIQGYIQTRNWQDKEGKTQYKTEIVVDKVILLDRYERGPGAALSGAANTSGSAGSDLSYNEEASAMPEDSPAASESAKAAPKKNKAKDTSVIDPDDLPF